MSTTLLDNDEAAFNLFGEEEEKATNLTFVINPAIMFQNNPSRNRYTTIRSKNMPPGTFSPEENFELGSMDDQARQQFFAPYKNQIVFKIPKDI